MFVFKIAASPMFLAMFQTEMKELKESRVEIKEFSKEVIEMMIKWIYFGDINLIPGDMERSVELFKVAHMYDIESLMDYSSSEIASNCTTSKTALQIFEFGFLYENEIMIGKAKEVIKK